MVNLLCKLHYQNETKLKVERKEIKLFCLSAIFFCSPIILQKQILSTVQNRRSFILHLKEKKISVVFMKFQSHVTKREFTSLNTMTKMFVKREIVKFARSCFHRLQSQIFQESNQSGF